MKTRRLVILIGAVIAVAVAVFVALVTHLQRTPPPPVNTARLISALQAFSRDHEARRQPLPATVPLWELVKGGYLTVGDVRAFDGMDVTISLTADETRPSDILARVRLPDGTGIALLGDGSSQQLMKPAKSR